MLIVCPNCATSYMIDPASVGPAGRAVRCARCKSTWFAGTPKAATFDAPLGANQAQTGVSAFVDGVIAEAEAESGKTQPAEAPADTPAPHAMDNQPPASDDFGGEPPETFPPRTESDWQLVPFEDASHNTDLAPREDHDPVAMPDAPSLVPPIGHEPLPHAGPAEFDAEEAASFVARRQRLKVRRQKSKRMSRWTAVILVLFAFNVALIGARSEVVRYLPQTASLFAAIGLPVNLRNLKFDKVKITKETSDGVNILIIDGFIANTANKATEVPRIRFSARNANGQDVYTWTALPSRSILGPKESMEFHSRLAAPPSDAVDVMVRFFTPQDANANAK